MASPKPSEFWKPTGSANFYKHRPMTLTIVLDLEVSRLGVESLTRHTLDFIILDSPLAVLIASLLSASVFCFSKSAQTIDKETLMNSTS
jgi:hypothetical protein